MKKLYTTLFLLLFGILHSNAQGIYQFWGITEGGGTDDQGVLFSSKYDGTGVRAHKAFELETPGAYPSDHGMVYYNGRLFGVMRNGGELNRGFIYEYDPATNAYTKKVDFYSIGGSHPRGSMVVFQNRLYGVLSADVDNLNGMLYEFDPATNGLTAKHQFEPGNGTNPNASLTVYNNKLYGTTFQGGVNGGVLFSYDPVNDVYAKLAEFNSTLGAAVQSPLLPYNNRLYGVASGGGTLGHGTLFEFNPANNALIKRADMSPIDAQSPAGGLVRVNNKLYGGTLDGGADNAGVIFEYDILQSTLTKKIDLADEDGRLINMRMLLHNNKLYGLTGRGGSNGAGTLFEYDPATNVYQKKVNFNKQTMGSYPISSMVLMNDKFYSVANEGGLTGFGTLFEYNPVANGITKKIDFMVSATGYVPRGKLTYYSGKLYGITSSGGTHNLGVIFSYDLATGVYAVRRNMTTTGGYAGAQGGMLLYNNKLYGVTSAGGNDDGVLYEFDPLNDNYTVKHYFSDATGRYPVGVPVFYNNKLYGTTTSGGNNDAGVLYEYDLANNTYTVRVTFGTTFGKWPDATLTLHNGRLYGTANAGGVNDAGTLFEYIPAGNGFAKRYDFSVEQGRRPSGALTVYNNKLYGTTNYDGGTDVDGVLFEYDLGTGTYTKKHEFKSPGATFPNGGLLLHNNKLYGTTNQGGPTFGGALFEYDPVFNAYNERTIFTSLHGHSPATTELTSLPALIAPGTPGSCTDIGTTLINTVNASQWVPFTDEGGNAVVEINANGNILGNVQVQFYTHDGATRKDEAGRMYLDRNVTIKVDNQPATPVSVRFYIRKAEFESLKATPGSGVLNVSDLTLFKNNDACGEAVGYKASSLTSTVTTWGLDYVYTTQVNSFSAFYVASKAYSALPVKLEYFKGVVEATVNRLHWKASCTEKTDFIIERSTDGIHFSQIDMVPAFVADCGNPFQFPDQQPVQGKAWYRLQMKEASGNSTWSNIILLDRGQGPSLNIQLTPNPVTGSQAIFTIYSPNNRSIPMIIYDATGKLMTRMQWQLQPGNQVRTIDVNQLPAGLYQAVWYDGNKNSAIRFIKQ